MPQKIDKLPLYGRFAGGFGILSVPPPDLRPIELLKSANSKPHFPRTVGPVGKRLVNLLPHRRFECRK